MTNSAETSNANWRSAQRSLLFLLFLVLMIFPADAQETTTNTRVLSKPWYMRKFKVGDTTLPLSPVSAAVLFLTFFYVIYYWNGKPVYCVASHILIPLPKSKDQDAEKIPQQLQEWKQRIGKDASLFAKYARQHSTCPSKRNGGSLGRFPKQAMTPSFDKLCFDPATPLGTAVGPIQTPFGWHLIYIHERQLPE